MPDIFAEVTAVGIQGLSGTAAGAGATGATGVAGASGVAGSSGAAGATGIAGASGPSGATGVSGASGVGASGISGASGYVGSDGASGVQGASGAQGSSGVQGASGSTGLTGATGINGATGSAGLDGDRYHTTSLTSFTIGDSGSQTITLVDSNLDYSIGQDVVIAYDGSNRQYGNVTNFNSGTNALTFDKVRAVGSGIYSSWEVNLDGAVGIQGIQGASGIQGVTGASGISGASGYVGSDGASGVQGASGASGVVGASGSTGLTGATGSQGINGASGAAGASGVGATGVAGASGISGASGYVGSDGATGSTGLTGATGAGLVQTTFATSSTNTVILETIDSTLYRSAKYDMQLSTSSMYQATELRLLIDLPNVYLTQYGAIGDPLGSFDAYYSPLSNDYSSPDINTVALSFWSGSNVRIYTTDDDVILGLLSAPIGTVFTLNSGAATFTSSALFTEVSAGIYGTTATTSQSPTLTISRIVWTGTGDIELRFTPAYAVTTLKYLRTVIEI